MGFCLTDNVGSDEPVCWFCGCHYTLRFEPSRSHESLRDMYLSQVAEDIQPDEDEDNPTVATYRAALPEPVPAY